MSGSSDFAANFPQEHRNIESDANLSRAMRLRFRKHMDSTVGDLEQRADRFFNRHKFRGPRIKLKANEIIGSVRSKKSLKDWISSELRLGYKVADDLLLSIVQRPTAPMRIAHVHRLLGPKFLHAFLVWGFRSRRVHPFDGLAKAALPCRLGLPSSDASEYLALGIQVPRKVVVKLPTAIDPGMEHLRNWRPGGKTKPAGPCAAKVRNGLPELVVSGKHLTFLSIASEFGNLV